jgi:diguanylate cyclase (GGDEF)-like protein
VLPAALSGDLAVRLPASRHRASRAAPRPSGLMALLSVPALLVLGLFTLALFGHLGGELGVLRIDDLGQLIAAVLASAAAGWSASRGTGRMRTSWAAISAGAGCWALGQTIWCYYELIAHRATPFPSAADAGYLLFPVGAAIGLWVFPSIDGKASRGRWLLDAGIVVTALTTVSWATSLGAITHAGGDSTLAFAVSLAYPIGDILILTMALSGVSRPSAYRPQLVLLSVAMSAMALADSSFTYLTATGKYQTGSIADVGWVGAFLMLAVAAAYSATTSSSAGVGWPRSRGPGELSPAGTEVSAPSGAAAASERPAATTMLPYVPLLVAATVLTVRGIQGARIDSVEFVTISAALAMVLLRQYSTVRENRHLLDAVAAREAQLHRQAFHDELTDLANRALFIDRVEHALELHRRDLRPLSVLFCDLDDFKTVNDTLGHAAGDALLIRVAERLRGTLRPGDTLARLGGDEFAVLLEDGAEPTSVAARIVESLRGPFTIADTQLTVRASVGVTELLPEQSTPSMDSLLSQADIAMYTAKRAGKGQLACYEPSMVVPHVDDLQLRQPLIRAVAACEISLAYQPIFHLESGEILGLEALARWTHEGVAIPPAQFIPIATRAGLLDALTDHVLDSACSQLASWSERLGHHRLRIGVNIPPTLITDYTFPVRVGAMIERHDIQPDQLVLEITEDALLDDPVAAKTITHQLRALGARLSLDDFGKGYSSLVHLQQLPLHSIKIDQAFMTDIDHDPKAAQFLAALFSLGRDLGLIVIAEGIERASQADILRRLAFPLAQGFLFARPGTPDEVERYVFGPPPAALTSAPTDISSASVDLAT